MPMLAVLIVGIERCLKLSEKSARITPSKGILHLLTRMVFWKLPDNAHVLCASSGTTVEILYLSSVGSEVYPR